MTFIAGPYTVQYKAATVGQARDITIEHFVNKQLVTGDNLGSTPQDAVYQGMEVFCDFILIEHNVDGARTLFWPYDVTDGEPGQIGRMDVASGIAGNLVLTAVAGTTAAALPATLTAARAVLAEGFPVRILYAPTLREVPVRMRFYPDTTNDRFYVLTV